VSAEATVRAFLEARAAHDAERVADLIDDSLRWTTPKGKTYSRAEIEEHLTEDESWESLTFARELRAVEPVDGERVLALYDQVYAWDDGLEGRVHAGAVFTVRDERIVEARAFLNADKARAEALSERATT
jgi:ketosteroid isomerase-like protein